MYTICLQNNTYKQRCFFKKTPIIFIIIIFLNNIYFCCKHVLFILISTRENLVSVRKNLASLKEGSYKLQPFEEWRLRRDQVPQQGISVLRESPPNLKRKHDDDNRTLKLVSLKSFCNHPILGHLIL